MKCFLTLWLVAGLGCSLGAQSTNFNPLKADAEKLFAEGSYARAREGYRQVDTNTLPPADQRWVQFRLADTQWRAQAGTRTADATPIDQARQALEVLVRDRQRPDEHDRVWVEVQESLGDFWWTRRDQRNWGQAWPYYQTVLDWWAGTGDIELARARYLTVVWKIAEPPQAEPYYYFGYYGNTMPIDVLENTLKIARTAEDQARAHYLIAMALRNQGGDLDQRQRVVEEFEAAVSFGKKNSWYDDALYFYAEWMLGNGRVVRLADGEMRQEPDYVRALELFRKLVNDFEKGETRFFEQAKQQIKNITDPVVNVSVANFYLPGSEIQYFLNWRNVKRVDCAVYPVNLNRDVQLSDPKSNVQPWLQTIDLAGRKAIQTWSKETGDPGNYRPGQETLTLEAKLPLGAYVLEAKGDGQRSRDLILVSDLALVLKTAGKQALVYVCNAQNGSPVAQARVRLWQRGHEGQDWIVKDASLETNPEGLAVFELSDTASNLELFASAEVKDRQAFTLGQSYRSRRAEESWKIYAFTDRSAYRPGETVQWKWIARQFIGSVYVTPDNQTIEFEITDPRGAKVKADKAKLNAFGSAWGSLELTDKMPLGEYRVVFWDEGRQHPIGNASLFRLEEYKLPEFKVAIQTPEEKGRKKAFRLGEKVEVKIQADYYFGGPVANASVEVVVYQNPFYHTWHAPYEFPWFYEDMTEQNRRQWGGQGTIVKRETLQTDATGQASLTFETPRDTSSQDFEYRIEARVTDASRREITGADTVRVTRQRYYVYPRAQHCLYRPQDQVTIEIKALDANQQPVTTEGIVKVTRERWFEIWLAPDGREVKGEELRKLQAFGTEFPPAPKRPGDRPWRLKFRGYEHDDIVTRTVKTDDQGQAEFSFTPEREGYYRITWTSEDSPGSPSATLSQPIRAETTVWVCTSTSTELGYRQGGLEIIVDKETFRAGQKAPVMLHVPTNDRYVLFSIEGEDLYSYQLVHLSGTVKLVEVPIEEKHVPNIFLSATMVSDRQIFMDTKPVVVPPVQQFLKVELKPDREQYQPREEGTLTVTTRDYDGKPVPAEVALSLVDESVSYIQADYAGDPRQFYFGAKRSHQVQNQSTFQQKSFARLVKGEQGELLDELQLKERGEAEGSRDGSRQDRNILTLHRYGLAAQKSPQDAYNLAYEKKKELAGVGGFGARASGMSVTRAMTAISGLAMPASAPMSDAIMATPPTGKPGEPESAVQVRTDFRSTVLWQPDVVTDTNGLATIKVKYPDSLTGWKATARVATKGSQFGITNATTRTQQPLIVRLQAPRFFVVGDETTLSAVVNNNTEKPMTVKLTLAAEGVKVAALKAPQQNPLSSYLPTIDVPAKGEGRVDWTVKVTDPGLAKVKVTATSASHADAMEKSYPIFEHGLEKFISKSGKLRGDEVVVKLDLPKERKPAATTLSVQIAPSLAVTMLDALPYLIDYPYGCTEQTMSRFLPAVITAKTLREVGLDPEDVMSRAFGGIETAPAAATHPQGKKNLAQLDEMTKQGLERLYDFQHGDGGWGWWKEGQTDPFMTAYVVWGMSLARQAGINVKDNILNRGADFLDKSLVEAENNPDQQAWMLHALLAYDATLKNKPGAAGRFPAKAFDNLWAKRDQLNAYTRALLALSAQQLGYADKAKTLIQNLENGVKRDDRPDASVLVNPSSPSSTATMATAHWGEDGVVWRWSEGGVEATAFALRALLAVDPQSKLVEPVTNWLIKNRRGAQWSNTRDTTIVVLALNDYLRLTRELATSVEYELRVNGHAIVSKKLKAEDALNAPSRFEIDPQWIQDGANEIRIKRLGGNGALYFAAEAKFFSLEEPVTPAGNEIFVRRQYYKLVGRPTLLKGFVYDKQALNDGDSVKSGERIETAITIEAKNNYEYLVFEDLKPAGFEAVAVRSGASLYARELKSGAVERQYGTNAAATTAIPENLAPASQAGTRTKAALSARPSISRRVLPSNRMPTPVIDQDHTGRTRWVYQELRDRKVALFIDKLPQGVWEIRYDARAEVPGQFHALPVMGHAMYVPEIRCNGAEIRVRVVD